MRSLLALLPLDFADSLAVRSFNAFLDTRGTEMPHGRAKDDPAAAKINIKSETLFM
jgi:hypothetical protein